MLKCMLCGATDESKPIPAGTTEVEKARALVQHAEQAERLSGWEHVQLVITRAGGKLELLAGDICPKEKLNPGDVVVARKK